MGDFEDITRVKYRYLRALDTKHWDEFSDTLTEDVIGDYGESLGEGHHFTDRESLVAFMRESMPADVITEHRVTHPEVDVDGDEATATWYLQDQVIGVLPRPLPAHRLRLEDQRHRLRPHLRRVDVDRGTQLQGEIWPRRCALTTADYLEMAIKAPGRSHLMSLTIMASSIATQPAVGPPSVV